MENGLLTREDLALIALIDFPLQIVGGWIAARWSTGNHKLRPWLQGYVVRLAFCLASVGLVRCFSAEDAKSAWLLLLIIVVKVLTSFSSYALTITHQCSFWLLNLICAELSSSLG